jgi:hypothetical protein
MAVARLAMVSLDCAQPGPLAQFWAGLLDGAVIAETETVSVAQAGDLMISAMQVPGFTPPTYPDGDVHKQIHLDLAVRDLEAAEAEALRLGATKSDHQPQPDQWRILLDPAGHPFCLTANIPFDAG